MCLASARNLNAGCDKHVTLDVHPSEDASGTDVTPCVNLRADLREGRTEADGGRLVAAGERPRQEGAPQVLSDQPRKERQELRGALERAIGTDHVCAQCKR